MDTSIITIQSGDTLYALAQKHGTTVDALVEANNISDPNLIFVGQDLHIPTVSPQPVPEVSESNTDQDSSAHSITVSSGNTLSQIAQDHGTTVEVIAQANDISDPNLLVIGQEIVIPTDTESTSSDTTSEQPFFSPDWLTQSHTSDSPEPNPIEHRFNDITGDQSDIHGVDLSSNPEADAFYGYVGEDGEGAWTTGTGLIDWENSDPEGWLSGFEILTAEGKGNLFGTFEQDDFWGLDFDAQVFEADFNLFGHGLNVGYLNADGNYGGTPDGFGFMVNANYADIQYSNGAPSATNSNDIGFDLGFSAGAGAGFNFVYSDPDADGISNLGFDISAGPVDVGITSEYLGQKAESGLESAGNYLVEKAYELDNAIDRVGGWLTGGSLFG